MRLIFNYLGIIFFVPSLNNVIYTQKNKSEYCMTFCVKKNVARNIAQERIYLLIDHARNEALYDEMLANDQARLARKIAMRMRIRLPYEIRQLFCKGCKQFILPGISSRVRTGRSRLKAIRITCLKCGHVYHKVITN
jgi:ribonuclease P protein subunit RPR2